MRAIKTKFHGYIYNMTHVSHILMMYYSLREKIKISFLRHLAECEKAARKVGIPKSKR